MKRNILHILMILAVAILTMSLPSCHSAKKADSERYNRQIDALRKGGHAKGGKGKGQNVLPAYKSKIIKEAYSWLGTPYAFGKSEKGVACDCSGLVFAVFQKVNGIKMPRVSAKQMEFCKSLKKKDVREGDLCFFATGSDPDKISHVGIMVDDSNFIHASSSKGVIVSDITQPYWVRTFKGFGRVPEP